ncbi:MAG: bifunctional nuclease family protein, partial [Flavobacteriales bacterium]|nr:bifunctional nuclease family protein [Flavobacteriales bacterium]
PRPLTHDLFTSLALSYNIYLKEVMIHKLKNGIFYSTLVCELNGEIKQIDSRTSDAIALALRFNCPIYTYEGILKQAGIILDEKETTNLSLANNSSKTLGGITTKESLNFNITEQTKLELKSKLTVALEKEDYKLAALIRDELNRRTL